MNLIRIEEISNPGGDTHIINRLGGSTQYSLQYLHIVKLLKKNTLSYTKCNKKPDTLSYTKCNKKPDTLSYTKCGNISKEMKTIAPLIITWLALSERAIY